MIGLTGARTEKGKYISSGGGGGLEGKVEEGELEGKVEESR